MPIEQGVIEKASHQKALIRIRKSSACAGCGSRGSCEVVSDKAMLVEVANDLRAKAGDLVEISMPAPALLKISFCVYLLPVIALLVGACTGNAWGRLLPVGATLASILGGCCGVGLAFLILRRLDRSVEGRSEYHPRMTRILFIGESPPHDDSR